MQRSGSHGFLATALTLATSLFVAFTPFATAQHDPFASDPFASDAVLAKGDPPLTESFVARFTNFQLWLLEVPSTHEQQEKLRAMLLQDWKKPQDAKNDVGWLSATAWLAQTTPAEREFYRVDIQDHMLKSARADQSNPNSQWMVAAYDQAHPAIAAGTPPLTESMVSRYVSFVGWLLEIPITQQFKDAQRAMLLEDWKKPKAIQSDMLTLNWQLEMAQFKDGQAQREYVRSLAQPEMIKQLRVDRNNPDAQALVAAYEISHRPIAVGSFPLTRQDTDAWAELFSFVSTQKGSLLIADQKLKDHFALDIAKTFAKLPADQQQALSRMPQTWAELQLAWWKGKEADRQNILTNWQRILPPNPAADTQLAEASAALERCNAFTRRDANTVSEQELPPAAKDAELVARQYRRQGTQGDLATAATFEDIARAMRAGKEVYRARQANVDRLLIMKATMQAQTAINGATAISNMYVFGDAAMANAVTNINNSPYQTVVVPVAPK